jgi:hypothetical protein
MTRKRWLIVLSGAALVAVTATLALVPEATAQRGRYRSRPWWEREFRPEDVDRGGVPEWSSDERFKDDVFTFARVRYNSYGRRRGGGWDTDYPDADLNFSYRLHQLTAIPTDPHGKIVDLTDEKLFDYPLVYMIEPGGMFLEEEEVLALRRYCLNGGFLWVDDFWGEDEWLNFYENLKRVFPDREPQEVPLEHPIFHTVYDLKKRPQIPSIHSDWESGFTTDRPWDPSAVDVHYYGVYDDKGRMMAFIGHNTDVGDGWEREGWAVEYFKLFSEKWSYPLGINVVTYAMTH